MSPAILCILALALLAVLGGFFIVSLCWAASRADRRMRGDDV